MAPGSKSPSKSEDRVNIPAPRGEPMSSGARDFPRGQGRVGAAPLERLGSGIESLLQSNRFYQGRLHPVHTWDDFERLPLTTKDEITADQHDNRTAETH